VAGGAITAKAVAHASADGYTRLVAPNSVQTTASTSGSVRVLAQLLDLVLPPLSLDLDHAAVDFPSICHS